MVTYGKYYDDKEYTRKAIHLLRSLPPEKNHLTKQWKQLGLPIKNAYDSQAALELYSQFCCPQKCLQCKIGASLVRPSSLNSNVAEAGIISKSKI